MVSSARDTMKKKQIIDEIDTLNQLAYDIRNSHPEISMKHARKNLQSAQKCNYSEGIAFSSHIIGLISLRSGDLQTAVEKCKEALDIFTSLNDEEGTADAYSNLGKISKSINSHQNALMIRESLNDRKGISFCLYNMGRIHEEKGKHQIALEYYLESLNIKLQLRMKLETARASPR